MGDVMNLIKFISQVEADVLRLWPPVKEEPPDDHLESANGRKISEEQEGHPIVTLFPRVKNERKGDEIEEKKEGEEEEEITKKLLNSRGENLGGEEATEWPFVDMLSIVEKEEEPLLNVEDYNSLVSEGSISLSDLLPLHEDSRGTSDAAAATVTLHSKASTATITSATVTTDASGSAIEFNISAASTIATLPESATSSKELTDTASLPATTEKSSDLERGGRILESDESREKNTETLQLLSSESSSQVASKKKNSCYICGKSFVSPSKLKRHEPTHKGEKPFLCTVCLRTFTQKYHLVVHFGNYHKGVSYNEQEHCRRLSRQELPGSAKKKRFACERCPKAYTRRHSLQTHVEALHPDPEPSLPKGVADPSNNCATQVQSLVENDETKETQNTDKTMQTFKCSDCGKTFNHSRDLKKHVRTHSSDRPYICDFCQKSFKLKYQLSVHQHIHTGGTYSCYTCGKRFSCEKYLDNHARWMSHSKRPFCKKCQAVFKDSESLSNHNCGAVDDQTELICDTCGESFSDSFELVVHKCEVMKEEYSICDICGTIWKKGGLAKHMRSHSQLNPFSCNLCEAKFEVVTELQEHKKSEHHKEAHVECEDCKMSFASLEALDQHRLVHARDEAVLYCGDCDVYFYQMEKLEMHQRLRKHSSLDRCLCCICEKYFDCQDSLRNHLTDHAERSASSDLKVPPSHENEKKKKTGKAHQRCALWCECGRSFESRGGLESHKRSHARQLPLACSLCRKPFNSRTLLLAHMRAHRDVKDMLEEDEDDVLPSTAPAEGVLNPELLSDDSASQNAAQLGRERGQATGQPDESNRQKEDSNYHKDAVSLMLDAARLIERTESGLHSEDGKSSAEKEVRKKFGCVCGATFDESTTLNNHMQSHVSEAPLSCDICRKPFASDERDLLLAHIHTHQDVIQMLEGDDSTQDGLLNQNNEQQLRDEIESLATIELESVSGNNSNGAPQQETDNSRDSEVLKIDDSSEKEMCKPGNMENAKSKETSLSELSESKETETAGPEKREYQKSKRFQCVCGMSFKEECKLRRHMRTHLDTKPFSCDICQKSFKQAESLREHELAHVDRTRRSVECDTCKRPFSKLVYLQKHLQLKLCRKSCTCAKCFIVLPNYPTMVEHRKTHEEISAFRCTLCHKYFVSLEKLLEHKKLHTTGRRYTCDTCGKVFVLKSQFDAHRNAHKGITSYKCGICKKSFTQLSTMLHHNFTHYENLKCEICGLTFDKSMLESYYEHKKSHNAGVRDRLHSMNVSSVTKEVEGRTLMRL